MSGLAYLSASLSLPREIRAPARVHGGSIFVRISPNSYCNVFTPERRDGLGGRDCAAD